MDHNTLKLGIACLAAATGLGAPASAAVTDPVAEVRDSCGTAGHCDRVIAFLLATGGDVTAESIGAGLDAAFGDVGSRSARDLARFLRDLEALGIAPELRAAIEFQLVEKVRLSDLPAPSKERILDRMAAVPGDMGCYSLSGTEVSRQQDPCTVSVSAYQT